MKIRLVILVLGTLLVVACDQGAHSTRGFRLPEGDPTNGQALFVSYQCIACHTVEGVDDSGAAKLIAKPVVLGGPVSLNKTYADLLTSIVNPSHRINRTLDQDVVQVEGESVMINYNDEMTISHLIDIVAFLQPKYKLVEVPKTRP